MTIMFAKRVQTLSSSATIEMATKAKALIARGVDIVDLSLGDPSTDPTYKIPQTIKSAAVDLIQNGSVSYTPSAGLKFVKDLVVKKLKEDNGLLYSSEQVVLGAGAKQLIFNTFFLTIEEGDEVIIPCPAWVSYADMVRLFGGKPIFVQTKFENGFKITNEELKSIISPRTKMFILNSPTNPTGSLYSLREIESLAAVLKMHPKILIMSDDIYEYLIFDKDKKFYNLPMVDPALQDRTIVINGTAKSHAMTGWRIGYAAGNVDIMSKFGMLQSQSISNACTISQYGMAAAIEDGIKTTKNFMPSLIERKNFVLQEFQRSVVKPLEPEGAFYIFFSIEALFGKKRKGVLIDSCKTFVELLLEEGHVATSPGFAFGTKMHFRISLGASMERIKLAVKRIQNFISEID